MTGRLVDLMVPIKTLSRAKTRLRGAADDGVGDQRAHELLAIALAEDTVAAARASDQVNRVIVITSDPEVTELFGAKRFGARRGVVEVTVLADRPEHDLNGALVHGAELLRRENRIARPIGSLHADLPALRTAELSDALAQALSAFRAGLAQRAFCPDAQGEGTTLLLAAPGVELVPRFGLRSSAAHEHGGALRLVGDWPGLRRDVDRPEDLRQAAEIGLGPATDAALRGTARPMR